MKPTIASLKKKIEALETELRLERIRTGDQRQRADAATDKRDEKDRELLERIKAHEAALESERRGRENAESIYDSHRNAVLHYFMAASNPETAKDTKRLVELQGVVVGLVPCRNTDRPKNPWEM